MTPTFYQRLCKKVRSLRRRVLPNWVLNRPIVHKRASISQKCWVRLGERCEIKEYVIIRAAEAEVSIGKCSQVNPFTVIYGGVGVRIGDNVMIGPACMFAAGNHDYKQTERPMRFAGNLSKGPIIVDDNVWIGAHCVITDGVHIGKDAVIAANSVVTGDIPPYAIAAGTPARVIGSRLGEGWPPPKCGENDGPDK